MVISSGETLGVRINCIARSPEGSARQKKDRMAANMRIPTGGKHGFIDHWTMVDLTKLRFVELGDGSNVVLVPGCRTYAAEPDSEVTSPELHKALGVGWNIAAC
jgi:hypothetical protein